MKSTNNASRISLIALVVAIGLVGCNDNNAKKPASQVAAKVNSQEISVHQINFALSRVNAAALTPEQVTTARQEVLNKLIDQALVVDQAVEKKLDRSPNVMMALEAARQEVLTRAYFEQMGSGIAQPTAEEVNKYYADHPQLFAERRVFNIQELTIQSAAADVLTQVKDMIVAGKPMEDIAAWLKGKDIKFTGGAAARAAEQLPLELLPRVHALKEGQGMVIQGPQGIVAMRVAGIRQAPIGEEQAKASIVKYLGNQRLKDQMTAEVKQLRDKAKITYADEFADAGKAAAIPATPEKTEAAPAAAAEASSPDNAIEKGVAGLK